MFNQRMPNINQIQQLNPSRFKSHSSTSTYPHYIDSLLNSSKNIVSFYNEFVAKYKINTKFSCKKDPKDE